MKTAKRIIAIVLCVMFVISSFPLGVISFGGDSEGEGNTMSIGYYSGMTLDDLLKIINRGAGLDEDTPIEGWSWYTNGIADYEYGRYLIDVINEEFGLDYQNVNVIRGLEIYGMYLNGEITEEELRENYSDVDMMFNEIHIDYDKLSATVKDALDSAERSFRHNSKYVALGGESVVVNNKLIELDPETDPHCAYDVSVDMGYGMVLSQTMYFPTRLELNGRESYPSILAAVENGETIKAKYGEKTYTIKVYDVITSEIVLKGELDYVYPINYNLADGDTEIDILNRIYDTVVDFEKSDLADDFDINEKNGFTVRFYDNQTGWYEFDASKTDRLEVGNVYDIEMIYEGDTTETVLFQIALFDPRINPSIAIYGDEKLVIDFTDDIDAIKQAVFENLIDKSDLPEDVTYLDFDYYYLFGGYSSISSEIVTNPTIEKEFEKFTAAYYDDIWEAVEANMGDHPLFEKISKEEFKEKYFTKEKLAELIDEERWIDFEGGYCPIVMEVEGSEITLFELNMPAVFAAVQHRIKVVYHGNSQYTSAETVSQHKALQIVGRTSDLTVNDGCYLVGSDVMGDMLVQSYPFDSFALSFEIDTDYLEITNIYVDFPKTAESTMTIRFAGGREESILDYLKKYLAKENYKLPDLVDFLERVEGSGLSTGKLISAIDSLKQLLDILPDSAFDASINYNGIPENKEGTYFVSAVTADLNAVTNSFEYGICFIVPQLDRDYQIVYTNEIPEEGFGEYPDFDFSAFVFDMNFEPYEDNPFADSIFMGYESGKKKIVFSYDPPMTKGQYIQLSSASVANPVSRYFDIGLSKVNITAPGEVFEYDGLPHGEPIITDYFGNVIELTNEDKVLYTNALTNEVTSVAPSKVGRYSVSVFFAGREEYAPLVSGYEFEIIPKTVDVWVDDYTAVYGDKLGEFVLNCEDPELLSQIEYTIAPGISYKGNVGSYELVINVRSLPEGYAVNKKNGSLTVVPRPVKIEMNDISIEYGTDYDPKSEGYFTVVEGDVIKGDSLGLIFEKFSNAGVYDFKPYDYTNKNYDLTVIPGKITIEKRKITLSIKTEFMYEGDELPAFSFNETCPADLLIHIAPSYYNGEPGKYILIGYSDNPNYDVTILDGILFVNPKPPQKVQILTPDYSIIYGEELPEFEVITDSELEGVEFTVSVAGSYKGDVGTYPLTVLVTGESMNDYIFDIVPGKLTVNKKNITVNINDYTAIYGDKFDPEVEYTVSCDDESVDLSQITFEIGAEHYNGQVGSYLFIGKGVSRNYNVTVNTATLTINPKEITVVPLEGQGKFEGDADGEIDYNVSGLVGKDSLFGELSRVEGEEVGLYEILLGSLNNPNYLINLEKVMYAVRSKEISFLRIDSLPTNLVYLQGTELNLDGFELVAVNADGSEKTLDPGEYEILGYDCNKVGEQRLIVHYKGHIIYFDVLVTPTQVLSIKIDKLPSKLVYIEGQQFTAEGITVVVFYDNGTYQYVDMQYFTFSGYDMSLIGEQTVTVEYGEKTDSFNITVVPKDVSGIEINVEDVQTEFVQGTEFNYDGLKVFLTYNNGTKLLLASGYDVIGYSNKVGVHTITVVYEDFTASYEITVVKKKAVELDIRFDGDELIAVSGNPFDPSQLEVIAKFNDGTVKTIPFGEYVINGYDPDAIGIWNATLEYGGLSYPVAVRVVAYSIEYIEVSKLPNDTVYYIGENFDATGIEIKVYYNNGTWEYASGFEVYGYDPETIGTQMLTVSYLGYKTQYKVTVLPIDFEGIVLTKLPDKTEFIENTPYDFSGIQVYMVYGENRELIPIEDLEFSGFDMKKVGIQTVTVGYGESEVTFEITVVEKQVVSIAPSDEKALICLLGSAPETEGVYIMVYYDNGEVEKVKLTPEMLGEYDNTVEGRSSIKISYMNVETYMTIWFIVDHVVEIIIAKPTTWTEFTENTTFTAEGIEVIVKFANGSFVAAYEEDLEFLGYDMSIIGKQEVVVRYANHTTSYEINVTEKRLSHIAIHTLPEKLIYIVGQPLDVTGLAITVYYDNGESYIIDDPEKLTVLGYDSTKTGVLNITVKVFGLTTEYQVEIQPVMPVGIKVDTENAKLNYYIHNALVVDGIIVYLEFNDGTVRTISHELCQFEGYDPFTVGEQTVKVIYQDFSDEYVVNVEEGLHIGLDYDASFMNSATTVGTSHDFTKLIVKALYSDGSYATLVYGSYEIEDYDYTVYGEYQAKIVYQGITKTIVLTVLPEFTLESATQGKDPVYNVHEEGLVINNLSVNTTVSQLKQDLIGGDYVVVTDKDGNVLSDDDYVGTGAVISFVYQDNTYSEFNVIVKGDLNGDGAINITDAVIAGHAISDAYDFDKLSAIAADVAENNGFNITDVVMIRHTVAQ